MVHMEDSTLKELLEVEKRKGEHILRSSFRLKVRANEHRVYPSLLHRELNSLYTFAPCKYGDCLRLASTFLKVCAPKG